MKTFITKNKSQEELNEISVTAKEFAEALDLTFFGIDDSMLICLKTPNTNRPGLLLAGEDRFFANSRVQILGMAEVAYLSEISDKNRKEKLEKLLDRPIPALILARGIKPTDFMKKLAEDKRIPLFGSSHITSHLMVEITKYIEEKLAEEETLHGVLVSVNGLGVLITGDSGIGKSETALELIHRGHKLIADDAVIVHRIRDELIGKAPELIRNMMELRGLGIIDVAKLYGVGSVLDNCAINLVIELVPTDENNKYCRACDKDDYITILGKDVPKLTIPIMAGRNLAIIIEVATNNYKLKISGTDTIKELDKTLKSTPFQG